MPRLQTDQLILDRALGAFERETGLATNLVQREPRIGPDRHADGLIDITGPQGTQRFVVEVKTNAALEVIRHLKARWYLTAPERLLFIAPHITTQIAERCREMDVCFADTAGNAFIRGPGLYVYVVGKRNEDIAQTIAEGRAVTAAGLRIVFALLCGPELLNTTYRDIAAAARVALGTVGPVIRDLETRKHVTPGTLARRILDPDRLLEEWIGAFPTTLRPKLNPRRFRAPVPNWTEGIDLTRYRAFWGGEVAANRILHHLQPEMTTIYTTQFPRQLIADHRLRADIHGDVEILDVFWNPQRIFWRQDIVPPALVYADLFTTTDGRDIEAAKMLYDQFIAPTFTNHP